MQKQSKFKNTLLGQIPENWTINKLEEISTITRLAGYEYTEYWHPDPDGSIIALRGFNISGNKLDLRNVERISEALSLKLKRSKLYKDDIVFPCVGSIGNAVLIEENNKYHINQNIAKLSANTKIFPLFLTHVLLSDITKRQIIRFNASTSQPNVLVGNLRKFYIPVPPFEEQRKIASILSNVYELIQKTDQIIEQTQRLKKGLINKLVTNGLDVIGLSGKRIPNNYRYEQLDHVSTINPKYKLHNDGEYQFVEMAAVNEKTKSIQYFSNRKQKSGYSVFKNDDTIFARITPCTENGKTCLVSNLNSYGLGSTEFIVLSPIDKKELLPDFLCYYCQTDRVRNYAISQMRGATGRQRVPDKIFKNDLFILLPNIETQKKIVSSIKSVENYVNKIQDEKKKVEDLKKGLMQQLLTGRLRVKV